MATINSIKDRQRELSAILEKAAKAYYLDDNPIMSDKQYDDYCDELKKFEEETGIIYPGSPNHYVKGYLLSGLKKVTHSKPMLSANKTKNAAEIEKFLGNRKYYASYKLDGLTLVVKYKDGKFVQGITRGNGTIGEDVTEQCRFIQNLPQKIPYNGELELRGECVITWPEFNRINETLKEPYSHPRNLAAGTLRNLDLNIVRDRKLSFVVFEVVTDIGEDDKLLCLDKAEKLGFETVFTCDGFYVDEVLEELTPEMSVYPVDGIIFELQSRRESGKTGATSHHENCRMAYKWKDETYETVLRDIEWSTSKTGLVNPVAVFDPVDLDGAVTTRATLHNISYIEELELGIGDTIEVYRANMVIPKVHENLTRSNTWVLPDKCPSCGGEVTIENENGSKTLHCMNPNCKAMLVGKLTHFCSKNAININGLSEQTIQRFVDAGILNCFKDIFYLSEHRDRIKVMPGFGAKSVDSLLAAIEKARNTTFERFIYSLSIPLIGQSASKSLAEFVQKEIGEKPYIVEEFMGLMTVTPESYWNRIEDFGPVMVSNLKNYCVENSGEILKLADEFHIEFPESATKSTSLNGKTFVVTGSVHHFANRGELSKVIEANGGKVASSVSKNTSYLINNDNTSESSKNKKAKSLGIPIITEEEFMEMVN